MIARFRFVQLSSSAFFAAVFWLIAMSPLTVLADSEPTYETTVARAVSEFNLGNYEEAQSLFRRAHRLAPTARTWRGLGVCAFELRQYVEAVADLEGALLDTRKPLSAEQRADVKNLLAQAREFVSVYHVLVTPPNAAVILDGKPVLVDGEELHLDPGSHSIVVRAPGYEERRADFRAGAGVKDELRIELATASNAAGPNVQTPSSPAATSRPAPLAPRHRRRVWTWTLAGGAVLVAAAAVGLRLHVNGIRDDYQACIEAGKECHGVKQTGQRVLHGSYGAAGVAGALLIGAGLALAFEGRGDPAGVVALHVAPNGLHLLGTF